MGSKPVNRLQKANYALRRTREWLESLGYDVARLEHTSIRTWKGRTVFRRGDIWGADLMAKNSHHVIFIQVKSNKAHISQGVKQLMQGYWPKNVDRWVVHWPAGRKSAFGPDITMLQKVSDRLCRVISPTGRERQISL